VEVPPIDPLDFLSGTACYISQQPTQFKALCHQRPLALVWRVAAVAQKLANRFVLDCGFWILNSASVPKWCKTIVAVLLLPVCVGAAQALWMVLRASGDATTIWVASLAGAACWVVVYSLLPKPMWIYVVGRIHARAWAWAFGGRVKNSQPGQRRPRGSAKAIFIALALYFSCLGRLAVLSSSAATCSLGNYLPWFH
jgi:hypothetical protein